MKCDTRLEPAEIYTHTHTHTHTGKALLSQKQIGTICFSKFFKFCIAPIFAVIFSMFGMSTHAVAVSVSGVSYPFSVTTTSLAANGTFPFSLSAQGTFYVDCGDGGTLSGTGVSGGTIDRSSTTDNDMYTCTYSTAGVKTIRFGGLATAYNEDWETPIAFYDLGGRFDCDYLNSVSGDI